MTGLQTCGTVITLKIISLLLEASPLISLQVRLTSMRFLLEKFSRHCDDTDCARFSLAQLTCAMLSKTMGGIAKTPHLQSLAVRCSQPAEYRQASMATPSIAFANSEILAINKPPRMPFHSKDDAVGVISSLRSLEADTLLPELGPLYPLHRLSCHLPQYSRCSVTACC